MISAGRPVSTVSRHVFLALAALALLLKVLIPAGFMAAPRTNDLPFAIQLCTSQGTITVEPGAELPRHGDEKSPAKPDHGAPCVFAGHAANAPPPTAAVVAQVEFAAYARLAPPQRVSVAPGRGVSGPPLPARGPPSLLI